MNIFGQKIILDIRYLERGGKLILQVKSGSYNNYDDELGKMKFIKELEWEDVPVVKQDGRQEDYINISSTKYE